MSNQEQKIFEMLKKRKEKQISNCFNGSDINQLETLFLSSPTDLGVCRNGGRRGASLGPQGLLYQLKKLTLQKSKINNAGHFIVSNETDEKGNFEQAQKLSANLIANCLTNFQGNHITHFGGGHDHIFPFLIALEKRFNQFQKIFVINIDAHLDTRQDGLSHSGTPFRQFANLFPKKLQLLQIGIHPYCNAPENYQDIDMQIIDLKEIKAITNNYRESFSNYLEEMISPDETTLTVLSLDADALCSSFMTGVSAVNHDGIPLHITQEIFTFYQKLKKEHPNLIGLYEYNPLFDDLSSKGARALASLFYQQFN